METTNSPKIIKNRISEFQINENQHISQILAEKDTKTPKKLNLFEKISQRDLEKIQKGFGQ